MASKSVAAVVLAAGQSRRMGEPKMVLPWGNTTVIGQVLGTLSLAGISEIVVVTGGARRLVEQAVKALQLPAGTYCVSNPEYARVEMLASLQVGIKTLQAQPEADNMTALVVLGDQPQIEAGVVRQVLSAGDSGADLVVPSYRMRRGHPWLVTQRLWSELLALQPPQTLRDFLNAHAQKIHYVLVDTPSILSDLDTPNDYRQQRPKT